MTSKQLLLSALRGECVPRIPWAPFLTYWWDNNLVRRAEEKGELGFKRSVGCDLMMRGHGDRPAPNVYHDLHTFSARYGRSRVEGIQAGGQKYERYVTPVGEMTAVYTYSAAGDTWFLTGHPVKAEADFAIMRYLMEDRILSPDDAYLEEIQKAPDALFAPLVTPLNKTGFQSMIEYWVGTEGMAYELSDTPDEVERTLKTMWSLSEQGARLSAASDAEAFISWEDTSTTNISPAWYERYIMPEINQWCDILHRSGKLYIQHACGHLRALAPLIAESKIDAIESVSAPPTGNITPLELREKLPDHITIIGGIEPTFFENASEAELVKSVRAITEAVRGKRFILANADSCPPGVNVNRFGVVTRALYEACGLTPPRVEVYDPADRIAPRSVSTYHGSATKD